MSSCPIKGLHIACEEGGERKASVAADPFYLLLLGLIFAFELDVDELFHPLVLFLSVSPKEKMFERECILICGFFILEQGLTYSPSWPGICYIDQVGFELTAICLHLSLECWD